MYSYIDILIHVCSLPACHFSVNKLNLLLYNQPKLMAAKNFLSCIHHPIEIQIVHKFVALFRGKESSHLSFHNICIICIKIPSSPAVFRKRSVFHPPTAIPKRCRLQLCRAFNCRILYGHYLPTVILIIIVIPSPTHSFIPGLKPSFSANPSHRSLTFSSSGFTAWIPQTVYCYF